MHLNPRTTRRTLAVAGIAAFAAAIPVTAAGASAPPASDGATGTVDCAEILENFDESDQVSIFLEAVRGLPEEVANRFEEPFTVFVPANVAFEQIPANVVESLLADPALMSELLDFHTVPEGAIATAGLTIAGTATSGTGDELTFTTGADGAVSINDGEATIVCPDLAIDDVTVHVIDGILQPPSMAGGAPGSTSPGSSVPSSSVPGAVFDEEQQAAATAWETVVDSSLTYDEYAPYIEDAEEIRATIEAYPAAADVVGGITARVTDVTIDGDTATVLYVVAFDGTEAPYGELEGALTLVDGEWLVPQGEYCAVMAYARNDCPAA